MRTSYEKAVLCPAIPTRLTVGVVAFNWIAARRW